MFSLNESLIIIFTLYYINVGCGIEILVISYKDSRMFICSVVKNGT